MPKATASHPAAQAAAAAKSAPPPPVPGVECRFCHQWETAVDDTYCGFCGHLLLALEIQPESLLITALVPSKELTFRNASPQPLHVALTPRTGPRLTALVFEPDGTLSIPPGEEVKVRVALDAEQLPPDFREREIEYVCLVNNDQRQQLSFKITVRAGPRPKLHTPFLSFGDVPEGAVVEKTLELSNSGGIPLHIREVLLEGSPCLQLKGPFAPTSVSPGQRWSIPVLWDRANAASAEADAAPPARTGVRLVFSHLAEALFVPARARNVRYLLQIEPTKIRLPQVLAKQDHPVKVEIQNLGTTDLEILSIQADQPWLKVTSKTQTFTLLAGEGELSDTTFARSYSFTLTCKPQELKAGKHHGQVTIQPGGQEPKHLGVEIDVIHPQPYPDYIGIDFGTTNSVVAVFNQETYDIELVEDGLVGRVPSPLIPSVLVFEDADTYVIGQAARNAVNAAPDCSVRSIKRIMGYDHDREFFGRIFKPEDLASCIIRKLVQLAERKLQHDTDGYFDVRKAIITVPANFYDLQIRGVLEACKKANLDTEEEKVRLAAEAMRKTLSQAVNAGVILDEPSAAVLFYFYHLNRQADAPDIMKAVDREGGLRLLVFDYGGGTLDVSVANIIRLENREAGLRILANMGDNTIGGDSIDLALMRLLLERCKEQIPLFQFDTTLVSALFKELEARRHHESWSPETWREILRVRFEWKDLSENFKIGFTGEQAEAVIPPDLIVNIVDGKVQSAPQAVKVTVSRSAFEDKLQIILEKCSSLVKSALHLAQLDQGQIDYIFHTGRQSLSDTIRERVRALFPSLPRERDILDLEHLKVCVAKGAALYGWMRDKLVNPEARIHLLSEGRRLPHSYGVEKFANFLQPEFDEIIPRGESYPVEAVKEYGPEMIPASGYLNLRFYQNSGGSRRIAKNPEVRQIGQISINTLEDGQPGCLVRFVIDANRKLDVFAEGQEVTINPARLQGEESWMG